MLWLITATSAYLIFAAVSLIDKYLLVKKIPNPKVYSFYVGGLGILAILFLPFVGFSVPKISQIILAFLAGAIFIYSLFWFFKGLQIFEASRIIPAVGGISPLFALGFTYIFSQGQEVLALKDLIALLLLIAGSILITYEGAKKIPLKCLGISIIAAFFLALSFVLTKYVYLTQPFWSGYILIRLGGVLMAALFFLIYKEVRREVFRTKQAFPKKTVGLFLFNQGLGASANILQNWSIALAPLVYVAVISALQGTQYVFLLIFTIILSLKLPQIIRENISKKVILQKIAAILLIAGGLVILAFK